MAEINNSQIIFSFLFQIGIYIFIGVLIFKKKPKSKTNRIFSYSLFTGAFSNLINLIAFIQYLMNVEYFSILRYIAPSYCIQYLMILVGFLSIKISYKMYINYKLNYILVFVIIITTLFFIYYPNSFIASPDPARAFLMDRIFGIYLFVIFTSIFILIFAILIQMLRYNPEEGIFRKIIIIFIFIELCHYIFSVILVLVNIHILPVNYLNISTIFTMLNSILFTWVYLKYKIKKEY